MSKKNEGPAYPLVFDINGRLYNWRLDVEWYKAALVAYSLGQEPPPLPTAHPGDSLVPLKTTASELGITRRTIGRKVRDQRSAFAAEFHEKRSIAAAEALRKPSNSHPDAAQPVVAEPVTKRRPGRPAKRVLEAAE
jgi:hypothetical protein